MFQRCNQSKKAHEAAVIFTEAEPELYFLGVVQQRENNNENFA